MLKKIILLGAFVLPFATQAFADDAAPKPEKKAKKAAKKGKKAKKTAEKKDEGAADKKDAAAPAAQ